MNKNTLEKLNEINKLVFSTPNLMTVLHTINDKAAELLGAERVTIYSVDEENVDPGGKPTRITSKVASGDGVGEISLEIGPASVAGYVAMSGKAVNISDVTDMVAIRRIHPELQFDFGKAKQAGS